MRTNLFSFLICINSIIPLFAEFNISLFSLPRFLLTVLLVFYPIKSSLKNHNNFKLLLEQYFSTFFNSNELFFMVEY
jgi:hypothetical protein